ncbi:hypothetical protein M440DRAFT_1404011 [Trichoderma longibrachiatum ATCC 18648]|uniref:Uncharacterized protein n=1 Tax=Trichoderma longibrachiatum ATCC 18648 TaxID=983965 RepID=A0A2T4BX21_TRILO|nr:hypothetical protein M440DRAFT_1404011 [Trichoderma longibrachiatum ATCC 18648]
MQNARVPEKSSTFPSPVSSLPSLSSFSPVPMTPGIEYTLSRAPLANPITSMPFRVRADSAALLRRQSFQSPSCHTSNNPPRFPSTGPRGERKRIRRKAQLQEVNTPEIVQLTWPPSPHLAILPILPFLLMPPPAQPALGPSGNKGSTVSRPYSSFSRFDLLLLPHTSKNEDQGVESNTRV